MGVISNTAIGLGRARYAAAQGLRTAWYGAHYMAALRRSSGYTRPGEPPFRPSAGAPDRTVLRREFFRLFRMDRENIEAGLYPPPNDLALGRALRALGVSRAFLRDVEAVDARRLKRDGVEVRRREDVAVERYPAYYRQNFHYQTDGWLSDDSARIYDHQVETLFTGAADAMRRIALAELARALRGQDQRAVSLLDIACGTGRFLEQVLTAYPRLKASGLDLSPNYADEARRRLARWRQAEVMEGNAESLPLADASLDMATSVYLFHELPPRVRHAVLAEVARVLKPGGTFVLADSLQTGDTPGIDGMLEFFPEGFHEPFYKSYLAWDMDAALSEAGFVQVSAVSAFLTKVTTWRRRE